MPFENLVVARVVLHEVFKRRHDGALVPPHYGTQLIALTLKWHGLSRAPS
jgi:hypothetical protein